MPFPSTIWKPQNPHSLPLWTPACHFQTSYCSGKYQSRHFEMAEFQDWDSSDSYWHYLFTLAIFLTHNRNNDLYTFLNSRAISTDHLLVLICTLINVFLNAMLGSREIIHLRSPLTIVEDPGFIPRTHIVIKFFIWQTDINSINTHNMYMWCKNMLYAHICYSQTHK